MTAGVSDCDHGRMALTDQSRHGQSGLLAALDTPAVLVDLEAVIVAANEPALRTFRPRDADLVGQSLLEHLIGASEREQVDSIVRRGFEGRTWRGRMRLRHADGVVQPVEMTCSPVWNDAAVASLAVLFEEVVDGAGHENRRLRERLTRLTRVTSELASADTIESVTQIVVAHSADAVGASGASLTLRDPRDPDTMRLIGLSGGRPEDWKRYSTFPVAAANPASEAVRTGQRIVAVGASQIRRRFPDMGDRGDRSIVSMPLQSSHRTIGAIVLAFPGARVLDATELEFFDVLADTCAQAVERIEAKAVADRQSAKLAFLADASVALASSLDYEATLRNVAQLAVPRFADWAACDLVDDGVLRRLAVAHVDPEKVRFAQELAERYPPDPDAPTGAYAVMRTGRSELVPEVTDEMIEMVAVDEEQKRIIRELRLRSAVTVPLIARERVLGVFTWVAAESGRLYTEEDLVFAEDVAKRAAIAIDNAELHSQTLAAAAQLQSAVLPDTMPDLPGWEIASFYRPSGRTEVGGDFYDAIPLADGSVALFVGDVMGRGVDAAAAMAQMRAAVRAYAAINPEPDSVMHRFDRMFSLFPTQQLVTLTYLVVNADRNELVYANAGHPPPVLLRADGSTEELPLADGPPLGTFVQERVQTAVPFGEGDTVLMFTDGLIERRDEDISTGQQRVLSELVHLAGPDLAAALTDLGGSLPDPSRDDDVAALAVRRLE
jgi:GAF domain-containing protein